MPRKNHLIVDSGCTQDNERWSLSACGLNEESEVEWDGKFTDSGRVVLRVKLLGREGERVCLQWQVSDTGKGIAHDDQALIFEPFYQTEGNTNVVAGTGLGLPICQRLTHLMDGTLRMVSEPGLGSSFAQSVPLEQPSSSVSLVALPTLAADSVYVVSPRTWLD